MQSCVHSGVDDAYMIIVIWWEYFNNCNDIFYFWSSRFQLYVRFSWRVTRSELEEQSLHYPRTIELLLRVASNYRNMH